MWKFGSSRVSVKQLLQDPELARMNSSVDAASAAALGVGVGVGVGVGGSRAGPGAQLALWSTKNEGLGFSFV